MRRPLGVFVTALALFVWSPAGADDPEPVTPDQAEVWVEVPSQDATLAVDEDERIIDIHVRDTRIYASDSAGRVDIETPGFTLKAKRK